METQVLPEYGGQIPNSIHDPDAPAQTREKYILDRIDYYKKHGHSDMATVVGLLSSRVVCSGRDGWYWLRRWYEEKQHLTEKTYRALMGDIAKSIDKINQRLKALHQKRYREEFDE